LECLRGYIGYSIREKYEARFAFYTKRKERYAVRPVEITKAKTGLLLTEGLTEKSAHCMFDM
jgi:hypothetical protein